MENLCQTLGKSAPITCGLAIEGVAQKKSEIKHCLNVNKIGFGRNGVAFSQPCCEFGFLAAA